MTEHQKQLVTAGEARLRHPTSLMSPSTTSRACAPRDFAARLGFGHRVRSSAAGVRIRVS
jgi:hypothetical protein